MARFLAPPLRHAARGSLPRCASLKADGARQRSTTPESGLDRCSFCEQFTFGSQGIGIVTEPNVASPGCGYPTLLLLHNMPRLMRQLSLLARSEMDVTISAGVVHGALLPRQWRTIVNPDIAQVRP